MFSYPLLRLHNPVSLKKTHTLSTFTHHQSSAKTSPTPASALITFKWSLPCNHIAKHTSSTSLPNHSLTLILCPIPSPPLLSVHPLTWYTNSNVWNVMFSNIGETDQMLSKHMNMHRSTYTIVNSNLQECCSIHVIHKLPDATNLVRHTNLYFNLESLIH
jgi:hypothetical protein